MKYRVLLSGLFLSAVANLSHATLIHEYDFNGNFNDSLGGRSLSPYARGTFNDNSTYNFPRQGGFGLVERIGAVYTLDITFQFSSLDSYSKVLDFDDLQAGGPGLYTDTMSAKNYFVSTNPSRFGQVSLNEPTRLTWVRDASGGVSVYLDGVLGFSFVDKNNFYNLANHYIYFFLNSSARTLPGLSTGIVDSILIYNNALTADQINPPPPVPQPETPPSTPPTSVPEPASAVIFGAGLALIGFVRRRRSRSMQG